MATVKAAKNTAAEAPESPVVEGVQSGANVVPAHVETAPVFRDKAFMSRTLILPGSGRSLVVGGAQVVADDAEALAYLKQHPEFEPLTPE